MRLRRKERKKAARGSALRKLIVQTNPKSPISEQYRSIRTSISFSSADQSVRSLMITSAGPGEGKSTVAGNLAVAFAQQEKRVLLIDADMRKPTVHYTFNLANYNGLTNVLTKQMELSQTVNETDIPFLLVLTSGPIPPNPAELLGSKAMDDCLEEACENFDIVIFDTPPLLAVTDAQILANRCDGTVMVINSEKTEINDALKAKELLQSVQAKIIGTILNNKKMSKSNYYYDSDE
ncbi:capsular biosynthesis protein [Bacillus sp. FJAT-27231]|uniref:CpsD/CapB family tyrosine-protein kinase n=1 Tax=Bacillus sp. FJAT-27231 TaxID=1679168 RepID=UPI0006716B73|nr:CpsD/CapB family tyrosine-protein kinase [Bacillus sp. FJAT-27231]KMY52977.1 capsular biosynthesis protein [Bacillus sp. FJAT-27231]